jgi:hypothetical protein
MRRSVSTRVSLRLLAALALAVAGATVEAQGLEEPQWLRLNIPDVSLGVEAEALREDSNLQGSRATHEFTSLTPVVGLHAHGSIYHPNLLTFDVSGDGGVGWAHDSIESAGSVSTRNESQELIRYYAQVELLSGKPYNGTFFAARDHTYQNYDFFNTATVDTFRYGGTAAWTTPTLSLTLNAGYRDEQATSLTGFSEIANTYLHFSGIHTRDRGSTTLNYGYDEYHNRVDASGFQSSQNQNVGITDSEVFGDRKQIATSVGGGYSQYSSLGNEIETINGNGSVTINHLPNLDSFAVANYTHNSMDQATSSFFQGVGGVRHRWYESLTSTVDVHGNVDDTSSLGSTSSSDRIGLGVREDYSKQLGSFGRLTLGGGVVADHEDHYSTGNILTVIDEQHQLFLTTSPSFRPAYLSQPRVIDASIDVRGPGGIAVYENQDYLVIPSGELTEIRLIQGSPRLHNGDTVLVTYQARSLYNASFESLNSFAQIRLDFLNFFGVYGRVNSLDNNAPPTVLTETLLDLVAGAEVHWRWAHAGAEYEDFDSNFSKYRATRFYQTFTFQPSEASTLGLELSQLFYRYEDNRRDTQYQFVGHFNTRITSWLTWSVEGGYFLQDYFGTEQNLGAARTDLTLTRGRLNLKLGYQYNYQLTTVGLQSEQRDRNFFYLSARRYF